MCTRILFLVILMFDCSANIYAQARIAGSQTVSRTSPDAAIVGFLKPNQVRTDSLSIALKPNAPERTLRYIDSVTIPRKFRVPHSQSLVQIIEAEYGTTREDLVVIVAEKNSGLLRRLTRDGSDPLQVPLDEGTEVVLPSIPRLNSTVMIEAPGDIRVEDLAKPWYDRITRGVKHAIDKLNKGLKSKEVPKRGTRVKLPDVPRRYTVSLRTAAFEHGKGLESTQDLRQIQATIASFSSMPGVAQVNPLILAALETPVRSDLSSISSPSSGPSATVLPDDWYASEIGANRVRSDSLHLSSVTLIAVVDSGLDRTHPALQGVLWSNPDFGTSGPLDMYPDERIGYDFVNYQPDPIDMNEYSHGTHVTGLATGRMLVQWLDPFKEAKLDEHIKVIALKVADTSSQTDLGAIQEAILNGSTKQARVFNLSFRSPKSLSLRNTLTAETSKNLLFVVAAGNGKEKQNTDPVQYDVIDLDPTDAFFPAWASPMDNIIVVAGLGPTLGPRGKLAPFSNFGKQKVQIAAPGFRIRSTVRRATLKDYDFLSGTSQAAPLVTFTAGLLFAKNANLTATAVKQRILGTCDWDPGLLDYVEHGCSLNLAKAINIESDLVEIKSNQRLVRGIIQTPTFEFLEQNERKTKTLDPRTDFLRRIWLPPTGGLHTVLLGRKPVLGTIRNLEIRIRCLDQNDCPSTVDKDGVCTIPLLDVADIIFRLE